MDGPLGALYTATWGVGWAGGIITFLMPISWRRKLRHGCLIDYTAVEEPGPKPSFSGSGVHAPCPPGSADSSALLKADLWLPVALRITAAPCQPLQDLTGGPPLISLRPFRLAPSAQVSLEEGS